MSEVIKSVPEVEDDAQLMEKAEKEDEASDQESKSSDNGSKPNDDDDVTVMEKGSGGSRDE